jgi:putative Mn2+ efflux pump MntP
MAGLNIWAMSALVAVFSFVTISIGFYIGRKYVASFLGNKATLVAGIFLILIGIYEFF